ncbi:MAG: acetyl-CoA C-acetyltransferase, partial [Rhodospirillaceae bacterium]|nr:acetyl-CoA C-acetyltransferase [Rhodospirillaceae bacterium]
MTDIVITSATRTAIGTFNGSLSGLSAVDLGTVVITEALKRAKIDAKDVSDVVMGQVLTAAVGQNPARQASIKAGVPQEVSAMTINQVCGSGLKAVAMAAMSIKAGDSSIVVAGGQESMSQSSHAMHMRNGAKMGGVLEHPGKVGDIAYQRLKDSFDAATSGENAHKTQLL